MCRGGTCGSRRSAAFEARSRRRGPGPGDRLQPGGAPVPPALGRSNAPIPLAPPRPLAPLGTGRRVHVRDLAIERSGIPLLLSSLLGAGGGVRRDHRRRFPGPGDYERLVDLFARGAVSCPWCSMRPGPGTPMLDAPRRHKSAGVGVGAWIRGRRWGSTRAGSASWSMVYAGLYTVRTAFTARAW